MAEPGDGRARAPVEYIATDAPGRAPEEGVALCLSGGGYRAMVFHLGALRRLHETGVLARVKRISSVSGGSITAGQLALAWPDLFERDPPPSFEDAVIAPVRNLARRTIDIPAVLCGLVRPGGISRQIERAYRKHLFHDRTLQDMPDEPRFVINATNVQSGALWRFMKPYMRDWRVGKVPEPAVPLARAVAASSAFPPVLSPTILRLREDQYEEGTGADLQRPPYTTRVVLTDGGVYDNLGLETAWKRYTTVLASDAGGKMQPDARPRRDWVRHSLRVFDVVDNQVRSLRKRQLIGSYADPGRGGAYWGIRTDIANYGLPDALPCPHDKTLVLAATPTRLKRLPEILQDRLINWGYAVCDAAIRRHYLPDLPPPDAFPYPDAGVG